MIMRSRSREQAMRSTTMTSTALLPHAKSPSLRGGMAFSALVHVTLVTTIVVLNLDREPARPPVYRINIRGAPKGLRQAGIVQPAPSPTPPAPTPPIAGAERVPVEKAAPSSKRPAVTTAAQATPASVKSRAAGAPTAAPSTKISAPPTAGAGAVGGKGADVVNVRTEGIEFPFPGYLQNIQRQIALAWTPRKVSTALIAEVKFMIRRDGSVAAEIEVVKKSGDRVYDADGAAAIEAVGRVRRFGPLPTGFKDDVLVVYFTFDYAQRP